MTMFRLSLTFLLLSVFSTSTASYRYEQRALPSSDQVASVAANLRQIVSTFQLPQQNDNPCLPSIAGNDSEAVLKMIDASGKPGSNLLTLVWQWLGDYDECQSIGPQEAHYCLFESAYANISVLPQNNTPSAIKKYIPIPLLLRWGLCVPRQCSDSYLKATVIFEMEKYIHFNDSRTLVTCDPSDHPYSVSAIAVIVLCCVFAFWVVLATTIDYCRDSLEKVVCPLPSFQETSCETSDESREDNSLLGSAKLIQRRQYPGLLVELFFAFSLVRNIPKLLDTTKTAKNISCLHGIRTLSMMWVILGHCYFFWSVLYNVANPEEAGNLLLEFAFQPVANAFFSVDSFFFLSGLLVMYLSLQQMNITSGHFPWIKFYIHRFWRLTPTYMMALLIYWKLMPYLADGPLWMGVYSNKPCDDYWWTNLLYINNFHPKYGESCMGWSWYLAADTQMYILSPIVIIPAYFFTVLGLIPLAVLLVAVLATTAAIVSIYEFPANVNSFKRLPGGGSSQDYSNIVYIRFYTRAAPYLIGMAVGYYLARRDQLKQIRFKTWSFIAWLAAFALGITVVYGLYDYNHGHHYSQAASSLYLTFSSALWGVCLAWVVYACTTANGSIVNDILSWPAWFPLSRLTYSAYLLHPVLLLVYIGSMRETVFIDNLHTAFLFVAITGLSYACAAILSLCVEYPMAAIEKAILKTVRV